MNEQSKSNSVTTLAHYTLFAFFLLSAPPTQASKLDIKLKDEVRAQVLRIFKNSKRGVSLTEAREERKIVSNKQVLQATLESLTQDRPSPIRIQPRDRTSSEKRNVTFTFYGKGARFKQGKMKTKIKLRARFYLEKTDSGPLERAPSFEKKLFLELKVKNPTLEQIHVTKKIRVIIQDRHLIKLYRLDPRDKSFDEELTTVAAEVALLKENAQRKKISKEIFAIVRLIAKVDRNFIRPFFATTYERTALILSLEETPLSAKTCHRKNQSFQLTFDENVFGLKPAIDIHKEFDFLNYFRFYPQSHIILSSNESTINLELKLPALHTGDQTHVNEGTLELRSTLLKALFSKKNLIKGYKVDQGKMSLLKKAYKKQNIESHR